MASSDSHHGTRTIFYGPVINPVSLTFFSALPHCLLCVGSTGKIEWMIDNVYEHQLQETLTSKTLSHVHIVHLKDGEFLMPGFIDTHTHAPQFPIMGTGNQYKLLEWLNTLVFPTESEFNDKNAEFVHKTYKSVVRRILDFGTTTCCYYGSLHLRSTMTLADITHAFGQRAFIGKCNMDTKTTDGYTMGSDYIESSAEESIRETHALIHHIRGLDHSCNGLVQPILTPRFALSCSRDLLRRLKEFAASEPTLRIQTHISENETEVKTTLEKFTEADSYAGVYDFYGLLRENTILGHAVHLTKDEVKLIKQRGAGIAHCPSSNFNLNSGIAPVGYFLDMGVKVGLGTDVSGGYTPSILKTIQNTSIAAKTLSFKKKHHPCCSSDSSDPASESHHAHGHDHDHRHHGHHDPVHDHHFTNCPFSIATLLYLATAGGAAVCSIEEQVGSFDVGKSFDALLVNVGDDSLNPGLWGFDGLATHHHGCHRTADAADTTVDAEIGLERKKKKLEEEQEIMKDWLERFLLGGDDRNIERVYVQGRFVGGRTFRT